MPAAPGPGDLTAGKLSPMQSGVVVTPADGADLALVPTRALWIGGAGNLNVDLLSGDTVLLSGIPAGTWLWLAVKRVRATNTTATLIAALY